MKLYTFHPEANTEYTKAAEYYAAVNRELAGRFYDEIERLIVEVRRHPDRFSGLARLLGAHWLAPSLTQWFIWTNRSVFGSLRSCTPNESPGTGGNGSSSRFSHLGCGGNISSCRDRLNSQIASITKEAAVYAGESN